METIRDSDVAIHVNALEPPYNSHRHPPLIAGLQYNLGNQWQQLRDQVIQLEREKV